MTLQTYAFYGCEGAPVGTPVPGSGYLAQTGTAADCAARRCNTQNCALCHGADGLDQRALATSRCSRHSQGPSRSTGCAGGTGFSQVDHPALSRPTCRWKGGSLSEQDAWDVAVFMNSHERPQDPRFRTQWPGNENTMTPTITVQDDSQRACAREYDVKTLDLSVLRFLRRVPPQDASRSRMLFPHC
jgi:cytochrome c